MMYSKKAILSIGTGVALTAASVIFFQKERSEPPTKAEAAQIVQRVQELPTETIPISLPVSVKQAPYKKHVVAVQTMLPVSATTESVQNQSTLLQQKRSKKTLAEKAAIVGERLKVEFNMLKDPKVDTIPREAGRKAWQSAIKTPEYAMLGISPMTLTARGPGNLGGRTRSFAFDTRNNQIMLAGGVSGGVFRSMNGGSSWTRVVPDGQIHNVTSIVQDPRSGFQDTWYFGGGESTGNSSSLGSLYMGNGIWKSTDNGLTWSQLSTTSSGTLESFDFYFDFVNRLVVDPTNGNLYAATCNTIMQVSNGGTSIALVLGTLANNNPTDIIVTPNGRFYAAFHGNDGNNGVWTSTTGATGSWTRIAGSAAATNHANWKAQNAYGRVVLAYAPSAPEYVYAMYYKNFASNCDGTAGVETELFKWNQNTASWTDLSANLPDESGCSNGNDPFAVQGGYDMCVAVKPDDANTILIGGTNVYRSTNGFTSTAATTRIGGYASSAGYALYANHHSDIHCLAFAPNDNNTLYCGGDGGIHKATVTDATVSWTSLNNNYVTYQFYYSDIAPTGSVVVGGAQDNGTTINASGTSHTNVLSGDGCGVGIMSYTSASNFNMIGTTQNGTIYRLTAPNWGSNIKPTGSGDGKFVTYFHLDQDNLNYLYYASGNALYRTRSATTLTNGTVSDPATGWDLLTGVGSTLSSNIHVMATTRNAPNQSITPYTTTTATRKLFIGTESGKLYRLNDPAFAAAATAPTDITPVGSAGLLSSIAVNPYDDNEVLITYSNYATPSVWHTTNASAASPTWTNVEGATNSAVELASARSCLIAKHVVSGVTHTIYLVGTSSGLYATESLSGNTTSWTRVGIAELNCALVSSMRLRYTDNKIVVGTHGNGVYELDLPGSAAILPIELTSFTGKAAMKENQLNWTTASEVNMSHFVLERSGNGNVFQPIAKIEALNQPKQSYHFEDIDIQWSVAYYRLKSIERDGKSTYSKIIALERSKQENFRILSNPVVTDLELVFNEIPDTDFDLRITDITGRQVYQQHYTLSEAKTLVIPMEKLSAGNYIVSLQLPNRPIQSLKIRKL